MTKRRFVFKSKEKITLNFKDAYFVESVKTDDYFYTFLTFERSKRLSTLQKEIKDAKFLPKPWKEIAKQLYFNCEGFKEGENYWSEGTLNTKNNLITFTTREEKINLGCVLAAIEDKIEDAGLDWYDITIQTALLNEFLDKEHLKPLRTKIIKEMDAFYNGYMSKNLKKAETRFCIVINGDTGTQKTKLSKLIVKKLAENNYIKDNKSFTLWKQQDLSDKLPRVGNKEIVILDDYDGDNHKFGTFDALTSEDESNLRIMGGHESTQFIKGAIFPSVDSIETWITSKTGTLNKFMQIVRRAECCLYIFKPKHVKYPKWEDYKDRLFYVGNVRRWIYETILKQLPHLAHEPLFQYSKDTQLARDLNRLMHFVFNSLFADKNYWNGFYNRTQIPERFWDYQLATEIWTEKEVIRTFKLPTYDWLRAKINSLDNPDFKLPLLKNEEQEKGKEITKEERLILDKEDEEIVIDIETEAFKDSPLKKLAIKSIQLFEKEREIFFPYNAENKLKLKEKLKGKTLIAFNSSFEQTHLVREGFNIEDNKWVDVALLAKLEDNRLAEEKKESLADLEEHFLGTKTKKQFQEQLIAKYGKNFFSFPEIEKKQLFQEYGLNDIKVTYRLYQLLKEGASRELFIGLQKLQDELATWQLKGIPFPRKRLERAKAKLKELKKKVWDLQLDIRIGKKTKAGLKGWSSTKLKTEFIKKHKDYWLPYLETTASGEVRFDNKAKEKIIQKFPDDKIALYAYDIAKKERVLQQIDNLLKFADKDVLYPNYNFLGAATGRFKAYAPELHNLTTRTPQLWALEAEENKKLYNLRDLLLGAENVFTVDFANQEDRMSAYLTGESKDIQAFLEGKDLHQEFADKLKITREEAKRARHGLRYGMKKKGLSLRLEIKEEEAERIYNDYKETYKNTFHFAESLQYINFFKTPIFNRIIRFSEYNRQNRMAWVIQGSCVDMLFMILASILASKKVELRGHFHDSVYLACNCKEKHPNCKQSQEVVKEIEDFGFCWKGTNESVFKFGKIKWVKGDS